MTPYALRLALATGFCAWLPACGGGSAPDTTHPGQNAVAIACGRTEVLQGEPLRLAEALRRASLRVVPISLTPSQGRWVLQDGWRQETNRGAPAMLSAERGTLLMPEPACAQGEQSESDFSIELVPNQEPNAAARSISARLTGHGETFSQARLEPSRASFMTLGAPASYDPPSRLVELHADPPGSLSLRRMVMTVGKASVELNREYREAIVASSVREAAFRLRVAPAARFHFAVAAADRPFTSASSDEKALPGQDSAAATAAGSWRFQVSIVAGAGRQKVFDERLPSATAEADRWHDRALDLTAWAGETIDLVLSAEPVGEAPALALWGSPTISAENPGSARRPNILLISIDTLRADRIGRKVNSHPLTPNLDMLASEGSHFTQCRSEAASTLYGHATMLTGMPSAAHGATTTSALPESVPYLPALLSGAGYTTLAITDAGLLDGRFGFNRGFDRFRNRFGPVEEKVGAALAMVGDLPGPWFLFLHTYQVHAPYDAPPEMARQLLEGIAPSPGVIGAKDDILILTRMNNDVIRATEEDVRYVETLYDTQVMRTDAALGRLFAELKTRGLWDGTIVAVTADHGEEFDEHGVIGWHSLTCYEEIQRVPLIVKTARGQTARRYDGGGRINAPTASLDIAPTLLDLAGLGVPEAMWGRSAAGLIAGGSWTPRDTLCEIEDGRGAAIVLDGWKYHQRTEASVADRRTFKRRLRLFGRYGAEELYRLDNDPREQVNLAEVEPQRARQMRRRLDALLQTARDQLAAHTRANPAAPRPPEDEEHLRRLRALGYVQ